MSRIDISNLADDKKIKIDGTKFFDGVKTLGHKKVLETVSSKKDLNEASEAIGQNIEQRKFLHETIFGKKSKDDFDIQHSSRLDSLLEETDTKTKKVKINQESGKSLNLNF